MFKVKYQPSMHLHEIKFSLFALKQDLNSRPQIDKKYSPNLLLFISSSAFTTIHDRTHTTYLSS